jgi:hypothetical protein
MVAAYVSAIARNWDNSRSSARAHRKTERSRSHRCPCRKLTLGCIGGVVRPRLARAGDGFAATGPQNLIWARATKRTYIRIIVPRPPAPLIHERRPGAYFAGASPLSIGPSLNGLLNNKFSTWAAASSTICSRGRPKFLRRCARTIRTREKAREPPALPASPWLRGGRRRAIAARWRAGPRTGA